MADFQYPALYSFPPFFTRQVYLLLLMRRLLLTVALIAQRHDMEHPAERMVRLDPRLL